MVKIDDFDAYFNALHPESKGAYPWQRRLVRTVYEDGQWPSLLNLPTGAGKTAAIDIAIFLLAVWTEQPRRIVFVVDRRIIVHQAARRAEAIATKLADAEGGILRDVAERLYGLASLPREEKPLECHELRGGIVRDDSWVRRPDVPAVIVSTVDQVGSRLLFRGYGVSKNMRPVHAGLLGNDTLFLLDEVHLAKAFADTLRAIEENYRYCDLPNRWQVSWLSATADESDLKHDKFELESDDFQLRYPLAKVLAANKQARTQLVKTRSKDESANRQALAEACADNVADLIKQGARAIGVIVNRVDTATRVHRRLQSDGRSPHLLTGRMRPLERDVVMRSVEDRLSVGRATESDGDPLVLVSTQTIEAGADFDFDAIVTECASLDALIQRFGRVDRSGQRTEQGRTFESVILATTPAVKPDADDPVYGKQLTATWKWLRKHEPLDFGYDHFTVTAEDRSHLVTKPVAAPCLLPRDLNRWVETSHTPDADPDPAHWLHGIREAEPEVTVVWRADVTREALEAVSVYGKDVDTKSTQTIKPLMPLLEACPPSSNEAMSLPLSAVRAWLARMKYHDAEIPAFSDLESAPSGQVEWRDTRIAPVVCWRRDDSEVLTTSRNIAPGMTLIVPASYGGVRHHCWDPDSLDRVADLGTIAQFVQRKKLVLRLDPQVLGDGPERPKPQAVVEDEKEEKRRAVEWFEARHDVVANHAAHYLDGKQLERFTSAFRGKFDADVVVSVPAHDDSDVQHSFIVRPKKSSRPRRRDADSGPDTSSFISARVGLTEHLNDVSALAYAFASACGLPDHIAGDLALAGKLHDLGKADPRFQRMLAEHEIGGDSELLAKSVIDADDYATRRRRAQLAGYHQGTRHELTSVALIQHDVDLKASAYDWDLVLHLVASHHGFGRPFFNPGAASGNETVTVRHNGKQLICSSDHGLVRFGSGVSDRFHSCVRRYGWFHLAWLEAILRLADHRASEQAVERSAE